MPALRLYDFLVRFNSSSNVKVFLWTVGIIHVLTVGLCMARAVLDSPNGWPWAVLFLNLFNLLVLTLDARMYGLSNPLMAFLVIISESLCLAANIIICFIVRFAPCLSFSGPCSPPPARSCLQGTFYMRGVSVVVLFLSFLQKTCIISYILSTLVRAVDKKYDIPAGKSKYARFASQGNDSDRDTDSGDDGTDYNLS